MFSWPLNPIVTEGLCFSSLEFFGLIVLLFLAPGRVLWGALGTEASGTASGYEIIRWQSQGQQTVGDSTVIAHQDMHWKKCTKPPANRSNCQHPRDHRKSERIPEKHLLLLYRICQSLWLCGSQQTGKFLKRWEYQTTLPASWETCMQVKKQQLKLDKIEWLNNNKERRILIIIFQIRWRMLLTWNK